MKRVYLVGIGVAVLGMVVVAAAGWSLYYRPDVQLVDPLRELPLVSRRLLSASPSAPVAPTIAFVGPRDNVPEDAPLAYGFWSFAQPVPGVLSRSGQPLLSEFQWLKDNGWRSVVNFRRDGERDEVGDDAKIEGFSALGLTYLHLPITDGHPPTTEQAEEFLAFVTDPVNQPVHMHCRGGIGRSGTLMALYRYAVEGWPMEEAIAESRLFHGGISTLQKPWLDEWARTHAPGSHRRSI